MPKAEAAAERALEINGGLPEARAALAAVYALYRWDWRRASGQFREAVENPPNPMVRAWYSLCLAAVGEHERAQQEIESAINRNPALLVLRALRGRIYYLAVTSSGRSPNARAPSRWRSIYTWVALGAQMVSTFGGFRVEAAPQDHVFALRALSSSAKVRQGS